MSNKRPSGIILGILSDEQFNVPEIFRTGNLSADPVDRFMEECLLRLLSDTRRVRTRLFF